MRSTKSTKRAVLAGAISILLCVSMLIGSTFAWFTDTAETAVNTIQAGKLDVAFMMKSDESWVEADGKTLDFVNKDNDVEKDILWEPGATYELPAVKLVNEGNLAFKFKLLINGVNGDLKLADVLDVMITINGENTYNAGTLAQLMADKDGAAYGIILPKNIDDETLKEIDETSPEEKEVTTKYETAEYKIALHMQETAGNDYQELALKGMALTAVATQYTYEYDSYENKYDADATYPITNKAELDEALSDENVTDILVSGGVYNETVTITTGKTVTSENGTFKPEDSYQPALQIKTESEVILNGGNYLSSGQQILNVQENDAKVTINGGTFEGSVLAWNCGNSEVIINDGIFNLWCVTVTDSSAENPVTINGGTFTLTCNNATNPFTAGTSAPLVINGGTFNVDPTNWLGEGHTATVENGLWIVK